MRRGTFIRLSVFSAAALTLPSLEGCSEKLLNKAVTEPPFLSHLFDSKTIRLAGQSYLKQTPAENKKSKLVNLLMDNAPFTESTEAAIVRSYFDKKVQQDFAGGKTVIADGWILSITEARQCALFELTQ
jgi:hypothetical protein